jgi:hypothetical protein
MAALTADVKKDAKSRRWHECVTDQVLQRLGTPPGLYDVQIYHITNRSYRVNVRTRHQSSGTIDLATVEVTHSYFCEILGSGEILASDPAIKKRYG